MLVIFTTARLICMLHWNEASTCIMSSVEIEISLKIILSSDRLQVKE